MTIGIEARPVTRQDHAGKRECPPGAADRDGAGGHDRLFLAAGSRRSDGLPGVGQMVAAS